MSLQNINLLFLILCILSCEKIDTHGYRVYKIKEGRHRSNTAYCTTKNDHISFEAIFNESAQYTSSDPVNQYDVNKLYGLSDCGTSHTKNSIRFGWRWLNDNLEILWYKREDGNFSFGNITTIDLNPQDSSFLSCSKDGSTRVWDYQKKQCLHHIFSFFSE